VNFTTLVIVWITIGLITAALALYRKLTTLREDDYLHLAEGEGPLIPRQVAMAHKLNLIDRWGKTLTVITAAFGLILAAVYLYDAWAKSVARLGG
jgi:hypothetical protein